LPALKTKPMSKKLTRAADNVPDSFRGMDYWKAMETFEIFDVFRNGELDKAIFTRMVQTICRDEERISKRQCGRIFDTIDLDGSGMVDKDEFLGWIFQTYSNYCGSVRNRLMTMEPEKVMTYYRQIDRSGDGAIDRDEFWQFINKFGADASLTRETCDELFDFIDSDKSGEIDLDEFLDWLHPSRKIDRLQQEAQARRTTTDQSNASNGSKKKVQLEPLDGDKKKSKKSKDKSGEGDKNSALFEMPPHKAVVLEFLTGPGFEEQINQVQRVLMRSFSEKILKFKVIRDDTILGVRKLTVLVGRGIVLWDKDSMMPYMEDPFQDTAKAKDWVVKVLMQRLPDLIKASQIKDKKPKVPKAVERTTSASDRTTSMQSQR